MRLRYGIRPKEKKGLVALVAFSAMAGMAIGAALADRLGGRDVMQPTQSRRKPSGWRNDRTPNGTVRNRSPISSPHELAEPDDDDLAPESITYLHIDGIGSGDEDDMNGHGDDLDSCDEDLDHYCQDQIPETWPLQSNFNRDITGRGALSHEVDNMSSQGLEDRVMEVFKNDPLLSVSGIVVSPHGEGAVELAGQLATERERNYALAVTRGVPGVERVQDSIQVRAGTAQAD